TAFATMEAFRAVEHKEPRRDIQLTFSYSPDAIHATTSGGRSDGNVEREWTRSDACHRRGDPSSPAADRRFVKMFVSAKVRSSNIFTTVKLAQAEGFWVYNSQDVTFSPPRVSPQLCVVVRGGNTVRRMV